jgi:hypothetical protein
MPAEKPVMYLRLLFWTIAGSYTASMFARGTSGAQIGTLLTAALFGAILGFGLGGMFANRATRKRS